MKTLATYINNLRRHQRRAVLRNRVNEAVAAFSDLVRPNLPAFVRWCAVALFAGFAVGFLL